MLASLLNVHFLFSKNPTKSVIYFWHYLRDLQAPESGEKMIQQNFPKYSLLFWLDIVKTFSSSTIYYNDGRGSNEKKLKSFTSEIFQ